MHRRRGRVADRFHSACALLLEQGNFEFSGGNFPVWHADIGLDVSHVGSWLAKVGPFDVFVFDDTSGKSSRVALWNGFRENERSWSDVEIFFFFSVDPFDNALDDEGTEVDFPACKLCEVGLRQARCTVVEDRRGRRMRPLSVLMKMSLFATS